MPFGVLPWLTVLKCLKLGVRLICVSTTFYSKVRVLENKRKLERHGCGNNIIKMILNFSLWALFSDSRLDIQLEKTLDTGHIVAWVSIAKAATKNLN